LIGFLAGKHTFRSECVAAAAQLAERDACMEIERIVEVDEVNAVAREGFSTEPCVDYALPWTDTA
jgi:hypothetical protein